MEVGIHHFHGIPAHVVLLHRQVAALVAVGTDRLAGLQLESGEEQPDIVGGNGVGDRPAAFGHFDSRLDGLHFVGEQSDDPAAGVAEAEVQAAVGVALDAEVAVVTLNGAEEEFQAAVHAGNAQRATLFGTDIGFLGAEPDIESALVIADLCLSGDGDFGAPQQGVNGQRFNGGKIRGIVGAGDGLFSHGEHSFLCFSLS